MSIINIKGRKDPLIVDRETAIIVKKRWLGDDYTSAVDKDTILDFGDQWSGEYGQIRNIEIGFEKKLPDYEENIKISTEDRQIIKDKLRQAREIMEAKGIINK